MTVDDVIKLSKAGLSDDLIIQQIKKKGQPFDLSADQIIQLKAAPVSERVIQVMINPASNPAPPVVEKEVAPAASFASDDSGAPVTSAIFAPAPSDRTNRQDTLPSDLPSESGVYAKVKSKWTEVLPEVVNWKTGGVVKNVATIGVVKGDVNGHVNGSTSKNSLTTPIEFLIVLPEGVAITEYQLLRLHQHGNNREFRTVTGGVFHISGGTTRDLMSFEPTKLATRTYAVSLPSGSGEYGFLPPGAVMSKNAASLGRIYSFRIVE